VYERVIYKNIIAGGSNMVNSNNDENGDNNIDMLFFNKERFK
jgi:hypothetical protein